jgi:DNA repair protein RadA/Sms
MAKEKKIWLCTQCGNEFTTWTGKCLSCGEFNSLQEFKPVSLGKKQTTGFDLANQKDPVKCKIISTKISTKIPECDRVLGEGFIAGSLVLFGGTPGIGKSTLALQIFMNIEQAFYFSGEENKEQITQRMQRLSGKISQEKVNNIFATNSLEDICQTISQQRPPIAVIDSIQMIGLSESTFGSISQLKENAEILQKLSKTTGTTLLVIGQVTKQDEIAGPRLLEHVVDTVLYLEGNPQNEIRILRAQKNRFGSTLEIGVFTMEKNGLQELQNPAEIFLGKNNFSNQGSCLTIIREGARNFLLEVQALIVRTNFGNPRRTSSGFDLGKLHLILAVLSKYVQLKSEDLDIYLNVIGGMKIKETGADLAICAAIISSKLEREISREIIIVGEIGLTGEVRASGQLVARILEAEKLGFKTIIFPSDAKVKMADFKIKLKPISHIRELPSALWQ